MAWTDDDERAWREMTSKREDNKHDVGKNALIKDLRELADSMERGDCELGTIDIEFIRGNEMYGYEGLGPVTARRITLTVKMFTEK